MRIAFFLESYLPQPNGVVISTMLYREELRRQGHEVYVFTPRYRGYADEQEGVFRFPSFRPPRTMTWDVPLPYESQTWRFFQRCPPDVVHVHAPFLMGTVGLWLARRHRIPLVLTVHTVYEAMTHYVPFLSPSLKQSFVRWWVRWFANRCLLVMTVSEDMRRRLCEQGVTRRLVVLKNPIDLPQQSQVDVRARFGIAPDGKVLLYVGRLGEEKNVRFLVNAFIHRIALARPDVTLMLVGDGLERGEIERLAERSRLSDRVVLTGTVPFAAIHNYYRAGDLFVSASRAETQADVVQEAMLMGVVPVVVRAPWFEESITDGVNGMLTDASEDAFADAVLNLLTDEERRTRLVEQAREFGAQFRPDVQTRALVALYEEAVAHGKV